MAVVLNSNIGNGNGTFKAAVSYLTGDIPHRIDAGDLDGDGILDLVTLAVGDQVLNVHLGNSQDGVTTPFLNLRSQETARDALAQANQGPALALLLLNQ